MKSVFLPFRGHLPHFRIFLLKNPYINKWNHFLDTIGGVIIYKKWFYLFYIKDSFRLYKGFSIKKSPKMS